MEAEEVPDEGSHGAKQEAPGDIAEPHIKQQKTPQNAFAELMKPKPPTPKKPASVHRDPNSDTTDLRNPRNNLLPYIRSPEKAAPGVVVSYNKAFVLIKDAYPKSTIHLLLLPRDLKFAYSHPYDALQDPTFLAAAKVEAAKAIVIAAAELRRLHGPFSSTERPRRAALESDDPPDDLPPGRDWSKDIIAGIHTNPSMNHMHIHILSVDRYSPFLKHRKHYNSFNTDFFVPVNAFPLDEDEKERRWHLRWHEMNMVCWRCGRDFGNKFKALKEHLEGEFVAWRQE